MLKVVLKLQLLLACVSIMAQDQNLHHFDLDYIVTATRDTVAWRNVAEQAYEYIQAMNALNGQPSQDDIVGLVLNFSKNIWDNLVPEEIDFSGRIDFSILGQEIKDANLLPVNVLIIRFSIQEINQQDPELWDSIQNILADAVKTLEEKRIENRQNPVDFVQSHIAQIREIIRNNTNQWSEYLSIWVKVEAQDITQNLQN